MTDRYKFNQFYKQAGSDIPYENYQQVDSNVYEVEHLHIELLAMDFAPGTTINVRKQIEKQWIDALPKLKNVRSLSIRHRVTQNFFEAICNMASLERLEFWTSSVESIDSIKNLCDLRTLKLSSFSRLKDISPILFLRKLSLLSVEKCFQIENYNVIGGLEELIGLQISGDTFAPKNLRLASLKSFEGLKSLRHLDLSNTSLIDDSYDSVLHMKDLERLDVTVKISSEIRDKIKNSHATLKAGLFMDYDFETNRLYDGKQW